MLPHALKVICRVMSDEMDEVQETEKLPGLDAITSEFIKAWRISGHQEKAPCLFEILLSASETAKRVVGRKHKL
jgi:hypothetical protein